MKVEVTSCFHCIRLAAELLWFPVALHLSIGSIQSLGRKDADTGPEDHDMQAGASSLRSEK